MRILQYQIVDLTDDKVIADCFSTITDLECYMIKEYPKMEKYGIQKYYITEGDNIVNKEIKIYFNF